MRMWGSPLPTLFLLCTAALISWPIIKLAILMHRLWVDGTVFKFKGEELVA